MCFTPPKQGVNWHSLIISFSSYMGIKIGNFSYFFSADEIPEIWFQEYFVKCYGDL